MGETRKLISNSIIVFSGSILASIFSYLFNMLMGRMLGPAQYGEMAAIISLVNIFAVVGGVVTTTTMFYVSELYGGDNLTAVKKFFVLFSRYIAFFSLLLLLLGVALAKPIAAFFSIEHVLPVVIAFSTFIFGFIILVNKGVLQGTQRFAAFSVIGVLEMVLRVSLAIVLVKIGLAVGGAILATVLGTAITYFITFIPLSRLFASVKVTEKTQFHFEKKDIIRYTAPVFLSSLLLAVILNLDVILVKHYFSSNEAGIYAALSTVAKIILYLTAPIISVMFPMVTEKRIRGEKHYKMFLLSLAITAAGALLVLGIYTVAPSLVMKILYGSSYIGLNALLPDLGVFILFYALINLLANYYLAIKSFFFLVFISVATVAILVWSMFYHSGIIDLIRIFIVSNGLLLVLMIVYYLYIKKTQILQFLKGEYEQ